MKVLKMFLISLLLVLAWVGIDRYMNIKNYILEEEKSMVHMNDSIWVNIPEERWIEIDREEFKPFFAVLRVDGFNSLLRTWENTYTSEITYSYNNEYGEPIPISVYEYEESFEINNIHKVIYEETIDNIQITYGSMSNTENVLQLQKNGKTINISFYKGDINQLRPLFESIWEDAKNNL